MATTRKLSEVIRRMVERDEAPLDRFDVEELAEKWSVSAELVRACAAAEWAAFRTGGGAQPEHAHLLASCSPTSPVRAAWERAADAARALDQETAVR